MLMSKNTTLALLLGTTMMMNAGAVFAGEGQADGLGTNGAAQSGGSNSLIRRLAYGARCQKMRVPSGVILKMLKVLSVSELERLDDARLSGSKILLSSRK